MAEEEPSTCPSLKKILFYMFLPIIILLLTIFFTFSAIVGLDEKRMIGLTSLLVLIPFVYGLVQYPTTYKNGDLTIPFLFYLAVGYHFVNCIVQSKALSNHLNFGNLFKSALLHSVTIALSLVGRMSESGHHLNMMWLSDWICVSLVIGSILVFISHFNFWIGSSSQKLKQAERNLLQVLGR